jgi:hypothetical protein
VISHTTVRSGRLSLGWLTSSDRLADAIGRRLDDAYHWFRHVAPGGIEPVEAVLVGPGGTWAISTAGERGRFTRRNGHWYRWNRSTESWVPWDAVPITAARLAARRLSLYLERASLPGAVQPLLLPPAEMAVLREPGQEPGLIIEREPDRLAALVSAEERLTQPQVDRIVALLDPRQPLPRLAPSAPSG